MKRMKQFFFLSTMDLHTFHLYQDIVVTKKYWHVALFPSKEAYQALHFILKQSNFCSYTKVLANNMKFNKPEPNEFVRECYNGHNNVLILFAAVNNDRLLIYYKRSIVFDDFLEFF